MIGGLAKLGGLLSNKNEESQSLTRVLLISILTIYHLIIGHHTVLVVYGFALFFFAVGWYFWVRFYPSIEYRKQTSFVLDLLMITGALCVSGLEHIGLFLLFCWVILGYGYRYGSDYIKYGGVLGFVLILATILSNQGEGFDIHFSFEILFTYVLLTVFKYQIVSTLEKEIRRSNIYQRKAERYESKSMTDNLTSLCNREYAIKWLEKKRRLNSRVAILFLDLDNFKKFNDNYGHHVGDHVLINISKRLTNAVRSEDVVCRYAGDEFIILINDEDEDTINEITNRITTALNQSVQIEDGERLTVTGSIGIAIMGMHGNTPGEVLRNADSAMYMAKRKGRNTSAWFEEKIKG